jgi:hypothetical protein
MALRFGVLMYHLKLDIMPWLGPLARYLGISDLDLDRLVACPSCVEIEDRVVVVVADRGGEFHIAAWRVFNRPGRRDVRWSSVVPITTPSTDPVAADERKVFEHLGTILQAAKLCRDTQIELCLPTRLLCCPLDGLKFKKRGIEYTVARNHSVLVRCWERHFDPDYVTDPGYIEDWNAAWKDFQAGGNRTVNRVAPDVFQGDAESVIIRLREQNSQGLILDFCPKMLADRDSSILSYLINAAVPVAILPGSNDGLSLDLADPATWRSSVKNIRANQAGSALTLLWDDPEGVPGAMATVPRLLVPAVRSP